MLRVSDKNWYKKDQVHKIFDNKKISS